MSTTELTPTAIINALLQQLQTANAMVPTHPVDACHQFTRVCVAAQKACEESPSATTLQALQMIQHTAGENLVQAALSATAPEDIQDVTGLLENTLDRVNNVINLGFYLHQHKTTVTLGETVYTAQLCAAKAIELAPENEKAQLLRSLV